MTHQEEFKRKSLALEEQYEADMRHANKEIENQADILRWYQQQANRLADSSLQWQQSTDVPAEGQRNFVNQFSDWSETSSQMLKQKLNQSYELKEAIRREYKAQQIALESKLKLKEARDKKGDV